LVLHQLGLIAFMGPMIRAEIPAWPWVIKPHKPTIFKAHFVKKGVEVAQACLNTLNALADLSEAA